jgi:GNAT superfamily N-acetyltransferase
MISIRRASPADVAVLVALMDAFYAEAGFALDHASTAESFARLLADPALGGAWLAFDGDSPVGHAVLTVRFTMEHGGLSGYVDDLFVAPEARRRGAGRALLAALVADCRTRGCQGMLVEVGASNAPALALYAEFGLHPARDGRVLLSGALASTTV